MAGGAYGIVAGSGYIVLERGWSMVISGSIIAGAGFVVIAIAVLMRELRRQMEEVRSAIALLQVPTSAARDKLASVFPQLGGASPAAAVDAGAEEGPGLFPTRPAVAAAAGVAGAVAGGLAVSRWADTHDGAEETRADAASEHADGSPAGRDATEPDLFHAAAVERELPAAHDADPLDASAPLAAREDEPFAVSERDRWRDDWREPGREEHAPIVGPAVAGLGVTQAPQPPGAEDDFGDAFAQMDFRRGDADRATGRTNDAWSDSRESALDASLDSPFDDVPAGPSEKEDAGIDADPELDRIGQDAYSEASQLPDPDDGGQRDHGQPDEELLDDRQVDEQLGEGGISPPLPEPLPSPGDVPTVVGTYASGGNTYVMYSDGSIEAETPDGLYRFASLDELKDFIAKGEMPPKVEPIV